MDLARKLQGRTALTFSFRFCTISNRVTTDSKEIGNSLATGLVPIVAQATAALKQPVLEERHGLRHRTTTKKPQRMMSNPGEQLPPGHSSGQNE